MMQQIYAHRQLLAFLVLAVILGALIVKVYDNQSSQLQNRIVNVATWCSAINQTRFFDQELAQAQNIPILTTYLDCAKLEQQTKQSGSSIPIVPDGRS